jgi:hypothetical protein
VTTSAANACPAQYQGQGVELPTGRLDLAP